MKNSCLGSFISFLLIVSLTVTTILWVIGATYLNPSFYQKRLEGSSFYEKGSEILLDVVDKELQKVPAEDQLSFDSFQAALEATITPANFKKAIDAAILSISDKSEDIALDFSQFKPEFKEKLLAELEKDGVTEAEFNQTVWPGIEEDVDQIFVKLEPKDPNNQSLVSRFSVVAVVKYISTMATVLLLVIMILLAKSNLRSLFRWVGYSFSISALISGLIGAISYPLTRAAIGFLNDGFQELKDVGSVAVDAITSITSGASLALIYVAVVIFVIGLAMIITSYFLKAPEQSAQPARP